MIYSIQKLYQIHLISFRLQSIQISSDPFQNIQTNMQTILIGAIIIVCSNHVIFYKINDKDKM